jgi:hypothetical protein
VAGLAVLPTSASSTRLLGVEVRACLHVLAHRLAHQADGDLDEVAHDLLDVAADIAHLGELGGLDLDERRPGELRQPAEISVLPTPVGPIIRMFFGITSSRICPSSCWRRQRLRRAMATARFASFWPMM